MQRGKVRVSTMWMNSNIEFQKSYYIGSFYFLFFLENSVFIMPQISENQEIFLE